MVYAVGSLYNDQFAFHKKNCRTISRNIAGNTQLAPARPGAALSVRKYSVRKTPNQLGAGGWCCKLPEKNVELRCLESNSEPF